MSSTRSAFMVATLVFLTLCCQTGSLLTVEPLNQIKTAPTSASIICHYNTCSGLWWDKDGTRLSATEVRYRILVEPLKQSTLTINPVVEEDEGNYHCTCNGVRSRPSYLTVHSLPSLEHVVPNQSFPRHKTAIVKCNATLGEPPKELLWLRHTHQVRSGSHHLRIDQGRQALIIEDIDDSDAGVYQCGFQLPTGLNTTDITVTVTDPQPMLGEVFSQDLPRNITLSYNDPLSLECRADQADPSLTYSWLINNDAGRIENHSLEIPAGEVTSGLYRCLASRHGMELLQRTVEVNVVDLPPILVHPNITGVIDAVEGMDSVLHKHFRLRLDRSELRIEWRNMTSGLLSDVDADFSARVNFTINRNILRFQVRRTELSDVGIYLVTVSNPHGYAQFQVKIIVELLTRTVVQMRIADTSCDLVEAFREQVAEQVVEAYNSVCSFCDVTHARPVVLNCQEVDRDTTTVTVTLLSQDTPPAPRRTLVLTFQGSTAQALICQGEDCLTGTTTTVPVSTDPEDTFPSLVVVSVVVAATVTLIVLLVVGLLIFLIRRTRRCYYCQKHKIGQEDGLPEQHEPVVTVHQLPHHSTPTGYAPPPPTVSSGVDPRVTPVTQPYPTSPPPHIAPLLAASSRAKRPDRLYFRSHSYHGSTRTPQA